MRAIWTAIALILLAATLFTVSAQPMPHSIAGYIFHSDGSTQVPLGTRYMINETNSLDFVTGQTRIPVPGLSGRYFETINGSDGDTVVLTAWNKTHYGNTTVLLYGTMENVNVTIKDPRPAEVFLSISIPPNSSVLNTSLDLNVTVNITGVGEQDSIACNVTIFISHEDILNVSQDENFTHRISTVPKGTSVHTVFNVSGYIDGKVNISASVVCDSDTRSFDQRTNDTVYDITIQDTTPPVINLESPKNNTWVRSENVTLFYNVSDYSGMDNCTVYFDGEPNSTSSSVETGITQNLTIFGAEDGNHTWMIRCYDNSTLRNAANSTTWLVRVDTLPPNVTAIWPDDEYVSINNTVIFKYNVTDENDVANCSLVIDEAIDQTNYTIAEAAPLNFTKLFKGGSYVWQVNCTDDAGNSGTSGQRTVNITDPDLEVTPADIYFSSSLPVEGQQVLINITVHNRGDENATNAVIKLFQLDPHDTLTEIDNTTANITAKSHIHFESYWTALVGDYSMIVVLDPPLATNGSITELNESNNKANRTTFVNMWQVFYGDMNVELLLEDANNATVARWENLTSLIGNVFVVDTDASISWATLQALGKNTTGHTRLDDFDEIDISLNTTFYNDSINRTYLYEGAVSATQSFIIFDTTIDDVPVINTTNTSSFVTGILWDYDDLSIGNYNGTQDVVFVGTASDDTGGAYGIYDYELRVPAKLREYVKPNDENTVTFYTELL
jgi:hypothetical protein